MYTPPKPRFLLIDITLLIVGSSVLSFAVDGILM
jgi:hypothetical protein